MSHLTLPVRAHLGSHDFLHFEERRPLRLLADCGTLWVTLDGELDDIEIKAGNSRVFDGQAAITVGTLGGSARVHAVPLAARPGWPGRLGTASRRWLRSWGRWAL